MKGDVTDEPDGIGEEDVSDEEYGREKANEEAGTDWR
jgi:hypothetical protein